VRCSLGGVCGLDMFLFWSIWVNWVFGRLWDTHVHCYCRYRFVGILGYLLLV